MVSLEPKAIVMFHNSVITEFYVFSYPIQLCIIKYEHNILINNELLDEEKREMFGHFLSSLFSGPQSPYMIFLEGHLSIPFLS